MDTLEMEMKHHLYPKILGYLTRAHLIIRIICMLIVLSYSYLMTMSRKAYNVSLKN